MIVVVQHFANCERFRDYKAGLPCFAIEICLVSMNPTDRCRRIFLFNLIVAKFKHKCRVCACSLVVVRQVVDCKRFSDYKAGLSCFAIEICLFSMNPTDRYRRSFLFNLVVVKFKYKCHVCVCSLVVVRQVVNYERFRDYKAGLPVGLGWFSWAGLVGLC